MKQILIGLLSVLCLHLKAQPFYKTMLKLPDTGQQTDFTNTFGEDADFTFNPPGFENLNNGILRDTITGLYWQQNDGGEMTFEQAQVYCQQLNLGAFTDWRLPNAFEAFSILNQGALNPAIDLKYFTKSAAEYWWTATVQVGDSSKIWVTNAGGGIGNHPKLESISAGGTKKIHVRAVRNGMPAQLVNNRFNTLNNGTILDPNTELIWQPYNGKTLDWEGALVYAKQVSDSLGENWRLPNIKELQSIVDYNLQQPALNKSVFNVNGSLQFWSSTTLQNQATKAWYLDSKYGITTYDVKTNLHPVLLVKSKPQTSTGLDAINLGNQRPYAYPNPFTNNIQLLHVKPELPFKLYNSQGQLILDGINIQEQELGSMPQGLYYLMVFDTSIHLFKLKK